MPATGWSGRTAQKLRRVSSVSSGRLLDRGEGQQAIVNERKRIASEHGSWLRLIEEIVAGCYKQKRYKINAANAGNPRFEKEPSSRDTCTDYVYPLLWGNEHNAVH